MTRWDDPPSKEYRLQIRPWPDPVWERLCWDPFWNVLEGPPFAARTFTTWNPVVEVLFSMILHHWMTRMIQIKTLRKWCYKPANKPWTLEQSPPNAGSPNDRSVDQDRSKGTICEGNSCTFSWPRTSEMSPELLGGSPMEPSAIAASALSVAWTSFCSWRLQNCHPRISHFPM